MRAKRETDRVVWPKELSAKHLTGTPNACLALDNCQKTGEMQLASTNHPIMDPSSER